MHALSHSWCRREVVYNGKPGVSYEDSIIYEMSYLTCLSLFLKHQHKLVVRKLSFLCPLEETQFASEDWDINSEPTYTKLNTTSGPFLFPEQGARSRGTEQGTVGVIVHRGLPACCRDCKESKKAEDLCTFFLETQTLLTISWGSQAFVLKWLM